MSCTFSWLCWMWTWMFLCLCGVSAGSYNSPPTDSSAPVGLHGYRRYFANDSLIGRPVPCTREDKICFRHNLVFNPEEERCGALGYVTKECKYKVNITEWDHGSGRLIASCAKIKDPCTGYRMAYDDVCYEKKMVHDVICGPDAKITRHPFGGEECRLEQATPIFIDQPKEDGCCVIPDIRFPDRKREVFYNNPFTEVQGFKNDNPIGTKKQNLLECRFHQAACFSEKKVFVEGYSGCHTLLKQGPCAEDHVVALDLQAATHERAGATCVDVRGGCPKGHKRMIFNGECHEDREIAIEAPGDIILNQFGISVVVINNVDLRFVPQFKDDYCLINIIHSQHRLTIKHALPPCGNDDKGDCTRYEVVNEPPKPEI